MKKRLRDILDDARPNELDRFSDELNVSEIPPDVLSSIKEKVIAKTGQMKNKKSKRSAWLRVGAMAACLAVVVGIIIVTAPDYDTDDPAFVLPTDIDNIIWGEGAAIETPDWDVVVPLWRGWNVDYSLREKLTEAEAEQYFALHVVKYNRSAEEDFVYEGMTIAEIRTAIDEQLNLMRKFTQLLVDGDQLKYGELLYTEGTPEGVKWVKSLYDERVEDLGRDFLEKYISDGEFDRKAAETDYANVFAEVERLQKNLDDAQRAYLANGVEEAEKILSDLGVCTVVKNHKLFIFITKEELAHLQIPDKKDYSLHLAIRRNYEHEEGDIPTLEQGVTGFALEKIQCDRDFCDSDAELIEKINDLIREIQFDTDMIKIHVDSSEDLSEELFSDMNYEDIFIFPKRKTSSFAWMHVKFENINLEALKNISNMAEVTYIGISSGYEGVDSPA